MRMTYLITVVGREGRRATEAVGASALFYARTLKTLNRKFGNTLLVAHLRFKSRLDKPQIKPNDRALLRELCQQIKLYVTWLASLGYDTPLYSFDTVTKALLCLPYALRKKFYKSTKDSSLVDWSLNLIMFERWLEKQLKAYFNQLVDVIATQEITNKKGNLKSSSDTRHVNNVFDKDDLKEKQI